MVIDVPFYINFCLPNEERHFLILASKNLSWTEKKKNNNKMLCYSPLLPISLPKRYENLSNSINS